MSEKLFDTKCEELAEYFLRDEPVNVDPENPTPLMKAHVKSLASAVQEAVDDWFMSPHQDAPK